MLCRYWNALAISICVAASPAWGAEVDWVGSAALGGLENIGKQVRKPSFDPDLTGKLRLYLDLAAAVPEAVKRQQDYNLGLGTTLAEQSVITGAGFIIEPALQRALALCFASGTCAIRDRTGLVAAGATAAALGISLDAYLVGKAAQEEFDHWHEKPVADAAEKRGAEAQRELEQLKAARSPREARPPDRSTERAGSEPERKAVEASKQPTEAKAQEAAPALQGVPNMQPPDAAGDRVTPPSAEPQAAPPAAGEQAEAGAAPAISPAVAKALWAAHDWLLAIIRDPSRPLADREMAARALAQTPIAQAIAAIALGLDPAELVPVWAEAGGTATPETGDSQTPMEQVAGVTSDRGGLAPSDNFFRAVVDDGARLPSERSFAGAVLALRLPAKSGSRELAGDLLGLRQRVPGRVTPIRRGLISARLGAAPRSPEAALSVKLPAADDFLREAMRDASRLPSDRQRARRALRDTPLFREIAAIGLGMHASGKPAKYARAPIASPYIHTPAGQKPMWRATPTAQPAVLAPAELQRLKDQAVALRPAPQAPPPVKPVYVAPARPARAAAGAPRPGSQGPRPGGISLSLAAAMRMPLGLDLDGSYFKDSQIVLAGRHNTANRIDAALFLTALRASCAGGDPYFSLDPDDGAAWKNDGDRAREEIWQRVRGSVGWGERLNDGSPLGLNIRTFSVRRDYPAVWAEVAPRYPSLKTRLVFKPEFLKQTRLGEILYKADVLLKELAGGAPALDSSTSLRASTVDGYASANERSVGRGLLAAVAGSAEASGGSRSRGFRLWFDFVPQALPLRPAAAAPPLGPKSNSAAAVELRKLLAARGHFNVPAESDTPSVLISDGEALDLSAVYPKMFVKLHDLARNIDLHGSDPDHEELYRDVNRRITAYANVYPELRALVEVFRAYVVAVQITKRDAAACRNISSTPLLGAEKTAQPLPDYHPSEIAFTVGTYTYAAGQGEKARRMSWSGMISGGVSLSGKSFYDGATHTGKTAVTRELMQEAAQPPKGIVWATDSGREFVALNFDAGELARRASELAAGQGSSAQEVLRTQQELELDLENRDYLIAEAAAKRDYGVEHQAWEEKQKEWRKQRAAWEDAERRWREAEARWKEEERKAEEVRRAAEFGPPVDGRTAALALPYAIMVRDAGGNDGGELEVAGLRQVARWDAILASAGYAAAQIEIIRSTGFDAAVYANERTGEITVAYFDPPSSQSTGPLGRVRDADLALWAAAELAWIAKQSASQRTLTLTGYGRGAALADYAAGQIGGAPVVVFNAGAMPGLAGRTRAGVLDIEWTSQ